jgi:hypothetical protein
LNGTMLGLVGHLDSPVEAVGDGVLTEVGAQVGDGLLEPPLIPMPQAEVVRNYKGNVGIVSNQVSTACQKNED